MEVGMQVDRPRLGHDEKRRTGVIFLLRKIESGHAICIEQPGWRCL